MLDNDIFIELLETAQILEKVMSGLESALDIQFCEGPLVKAQCKIMDLLVDNCENLDKNEDSYIYKFAFEHKWGEIVDTQYVGDRKYTIDSFYTLYSYLEDKYMQEERK